MDVWLGSVGLEFHVLRCLGTTGAARLVVQEVMLRGMMGARGRINLVVQVDRNRWRTLQSTRENGERLIVNDRFAGSNTDPGWFNPLPAR